MVIFSFKICIESTQTSNKENLMMFSDPGFLIVLTVGAIILGSVLREAFK